MVVKVRWTATISLLRNSSLSHPAAEMEGYPHHHHNIIGSTNTPLLSPALADIDALREGLHNLLPLLGHSSVMDSSSSPIHAASTNYAALAPPSLLSRLISAYSASLLSPPTAANWPDPLSAALLHHLSGQTVPPLGLLQNPFITSPVVCLPSACPLEERQSVIQLVENGNVTAMPMCFEPEIVFPSGKPNANESVAVETNSPAISLHSSPSSSIGSSCRTRSSTVNRLSYPREFKLMVIECYLANGQNKYRTCKEFRITKSMLNSWLQKESKIRASKPGSLKAGHH